MISEWVGLLVGSCTHYWRITLLGTPEHVYIIVITHFSSVSATGDIVSVIILPVSTKQDLVNVAFTDAVSLFLYPNHHKSSKSVLLYDVLARQRAASYVRK